MTDTLQRLIAHYKTKVENATHNKGKGLAALSLIKKRLLEIETIQTLHFSKSVHISRSRQLGNNILVSAIKHKKQEILDLCEDISLFVF